VKLSDLGRLVAQHLGQGKGDWEINIFQWEHQSQPVTDFLERPGILEFYSGTDGKRQECPSNGKWQETLNYGSAPEEDDYDNLI
jgi:hypothetical protein